MTHVGAPFDSDLSQVDDERFMRAALSLGRQNLGRTSPNPSVGAIVVRDGVVVGRGCTAPGGRPHAETIALAEAGDAARGATIYVTLEPCSHHGSTPPCCEAIAAAGVARLVYACDDPNPAVAGRGAAFVRARGIEVVSGICAEAARCDHLGHILRMTEERPLVTLKLAQTADGYAAGDAHDPRLAITGAATNGMVHVLRAMHDAIMVGVGTVRADDPLLTVRLPGIATAPLRVVLDARLELSPRSRLVQTAATSPVLLLCGVNAPGRHRDALNAVTGVEITDVALDPLGRIALPAALRALALRGLTRVLSEGGPTVAAALIAEGLADRVVLATSPKPLGGRDGVPALGEEARRTLARCYDRIDIRTVGVDRVSSYAKATSCSPA